jgi:hypothetical protein
VSNKSGRSQADSEAEMGYGATRSLERVAAAMGELEAAPIQFEAARDVAHLTQLQHPNANFAWFWEVSLLFSTRVRLKA